MSSERIKTWPTKEPPRERLLTEDPERMKGGELLAIILRVGSGTFKEGIPGKNAYDYSYAGSWGLEGYAVDRSLHLT